VRAWVFSSLQEFVPLECEGISAGGGDQWKRPHDMAFDRKSRDRMFI